MNTKTVNKFLFDGKEDCFDEHIKLSIMHYEFMVEQVKNYICAFTEEGSYVIDYGCSTGKMMEEIPKTNAMYIGYDTSTLLKEGKRGGAEFTREDFFNVDIPEGSCSVISSIFFLQFLPRSKRLCALEKINKQLSNTGCLIIAEKVHHNNARMESVTQTNYVTNKRELFSDKEILDKQQQTINSMKLSTESEIMKELRIIGEPHIFWKSYNFSAYVVFKK